VNQYQHISRKTSKIAPGHVPQPVLVHDGRVFYSTGYWSNGWEVATAPIGHTERCHLTSTHTVCDNEGTPSGLDQESRLPVDAC